MPKEQTAAADEIEAARTVSTARNLATTPSGAVGRVRSGSAVNVSVGAVPAEVRAALERVPGVTIVTEGRPELVVAIASEPPEGSRPDGPAVLVVGEPATAHLGWLEHDVDLWTTPERLVAAPEETVRKALAAWLALRIGPGTSRTGWLEAIAVLTGAAAVARVAPERVDWFPGPVEDLPTDLVATAGRAGGAAMAPREAVALRLELPDTAFDGLVAVPLGPRHTDGVLVALVYEDGPAWVRAAMPTVRAAAVVALRDALVRRAIAAETGRRWIEKVLHRLLSVVSHDLRNPLFAVQLGVKILERQHGRTEQITTVQNTIATATQLLRRIVEAGRQVLDTPSVPPVGFGTDLVDLWARVADASRRRFPGRTITGGPAARHVAVDPMTLERVLTTVLDNALQHAPGPEPVVVSSRSEDGVLILEIRNKGRLPFIDSDRVEPFEHRSSGGIGVGLYLARRLAAAAGAKLRVRQDGADVETTLVLPTR